MKNSTTRSIEKIVEDQALQWQKLNANKKTEPEGINVITVSREYGSGGSIIAKMLADKLGYDLFHREVIHEMAKSAKTSERIVQTLDEKGLSLLEESIAALVNDRYLWPDQYLRYLMRVIGTIGRHGNAVIVGRCANFILPPEKNLRVRVVASLSRRLQIIAQRRNVSASEAQKIVLKTDHDRRSFSHKYFYADLSDPVHYDMIINTDRVSYETAVESIIAGLKSFKQNDSLMRLSVN